jgi:hypothetical protein
MERAWDIGRGVGGTVTVAVLDSGVAFADVRIDHPSPVLVVSTRSAAISGEVLHRGLDGGWRSDPVLDQNGRESGDVGGGHRRALGDAVDEHVESAAPAG